jgi:hypothetical protein
MFPLSLTQTWTLARTRDQSMASDMQVPDLCRHLFANSRAAFYIKTCLSPALHCFIRQRVLREKSQPRHLIAISKDCENVRTAGKTKHESI